MFHTQKTYFLIRINDNMHTVTTLSPRLTENTAACVNRKRWSCAAVAQRYGAPFDCSLAVQQTHMYQDQHLDTPSTLVAKLASKRRHDLLKPLKTSWDIMERSDGHGRGSSSDVSSQDWRVSRGTVDVNYKLCCNSFCYVGSKFMDRTIRRDISCGCRTGK